MKLGSFFIRIKPIQLFIVCATAKKTSKLLTSLNYFLKKKKPFAYLSNASTMFYTKRKKKEKKKANKQTNASTMLKYMGLKWSMWSYKFDPKYFSIRCTILWISYFIFLFFCLFTDIFELEHLLKPVSIWSISDKKYMARACNLIKVRSN